MVDIHLFRTDGEKAIELKSYSVELEKSLQTYMENNLENLLGITFLESEYSTGKTHAGRIDTLGIDENGFPVIIEYKRAINENVINQGLYYLDWLLDHKGEFELKVLKKLGEDYRNKLDWTNPRLVCIAGDYTKYDIHAVQQINRNIELIKYRKFDSDLLLLELVNVTSALTTVAANTSSLKNVGAQKTISEMYESLNPDVRDRYEKLKAYIEALGDDIVVKPLKIYIAFKRFKNFACITFPKDIILVWLKVDPSTVIIENGFTRDVSEIGHWGTGDLEVQIKTDSDLEKAKQLIIRDYEEN